MDRNLHDINEVIVRFNSLQEMKSSKRGGTVYKNLYKKIIFQEIQKFEFNDKSILYNVFEVSVDAISPGVESEEFRTQKINIKVIVYESNKEINYIINRNSDALKYLRKIFSYEEKSAIVKNSITFKGDNFLWLIKKVFYGENSFKINNSMQKSKELIINQIIGIRGETSDENRLSAQGNTVFNLISTLSFILETKQVRQLMLRLEHTEHENIEVILNDRGKVSVDTDSYSGVYEDFEIDKKIAIILLFVYIDVLPKFILFYYSDIKNNNWTFETRNTFLDDLQEELLHRLKEKKQYLEQMTLPI
ncbi:hypothetical protein [Enterococcus cecorum]|uniref:hypothetical protein n=1 Tax=Enterococcus cecorum TaxID=44008 RepID=UPI00148B8006|nr:hypothetical protein [Enterococcus cecorum]